MRDIAALAGMPGLEMLEPSCESEVAQAVAYCLEEARTSCYLRLVSIPCRVPYRLPGDYRLERGRGLALTDGGEGVLFGYGPVLLSEAYRASALLRERYGLGLRVVNLPWLNLVDRDWLASEVADKAQIFFLDDHYVSGGQGEMLAATLAELGLAGGRTRPPLRPPRHSRLWPERRSPPCPPPGRGIPSRGPGGGYEGRAARLTLVFWDIDGTLLTTGRAGIFAWQEALHEVTGREVDLWSFDTAGHPDFGIARRLLSEYGGQTEPGPATVRRLVERYEDRLPQALHRRVGHVMPNVREILTLLARVPEVCSLLLTGNTRRGARAKLDHYGLSEFLSDGAFSEPDADRNTIARAALERAAARGCGVAPGGVLVVGDTPHDVSCAGAIGARALAVATGVYDIPALEAMGAWRVYRQLPPPGEFLSLLDGREAVHG